MHLRHTTCQIMDDNIWPSEDIPEFKKAYCQIVSILMDVSKKMCNQIDKYI